MTKQECLKILGLSSDATETDIKKAYRSLANKYHPDKENGDEQKFVEIGEAYRALKENKFSSNANHHREYYYNRAAGYGYSDDPVEDLKEYVRRNFGDEFGDIFGNYGYERRAARSEVITTYVITLDDVYHGNTIRTAKHGRITIPRGIYDNEIFTTTNDKSKIKFRLQKHPIYTRKSSRSPDLTTIIEMSTMTLAIGGKVTLDHFDESIEVDIQSGTSPSVVLRVKNAGLPVMNKENKYGDLYIHIKPVTPKLKQKELKKLKKIFGSSLDIEVKK